MRTRQVALVLACFALALAALPPAAVGLETNFVVLTTSFTGTGYLTDLLRLHGHVCLTKNVFRSVELFFAQRLGQADSVQSLLSRNEKHPMLSANSEFQRLYKEQLARLNAPRGGDDDVRHHIGQRRAGKSSSEVEQGQLDAAQRLLDVFHSNERCKFWDGRIKQPRYPYEARGTVIDVTNHCPWRWEHSLSSYRGSDTEADDRQQWKCSAQLVLDALASVGDVKVVFLTRRNSLDQVVSAMDYAYRWNNTVAVDTRKIDLNPLELERKLEIVVDTNERVRDALEDLGLPFIELLFEDLVADPKKNIDAVADFLDISPYSTSPVREAARLPRPITRSSLPKEARFRNWPAISRALAQTPKYRDFLDPKYYIDQY